MMIDCFFTSSFQWPCDGYQKLETCQCHSCFRPILSTVFGPRGEDREEIAIDKSRFCKTSRHVESVGFLIVELQPAFEITKTCEGVVTEMVSTILVATAAAKLSCC